MAVINVLIADAHEISRAGLRALLDAAEDMRVVGEADNGRDAVRLARELEPEVVTMDVAMPELNGIDATRRIVAELPEIGVVGVSMDGQRQYAPAMIEAGAMGYVLKENAADELVEAVREVAKGEFLIGEGVGVF